MSGRRGRSVLPFLLVLGNLGGCGGDGGGGKDAGPSDAGDARGDGAPDAPAEVAPPPAPPAVDPDAGAGVDAPAPVPDSGDGPPVMPPAVDAPGPAPGATLACSNLPRPADPYRLADPFPALPAFDAPTAAVQAPGQPQYWYVTEQEGRVKRFESRADVTSAQVVLDLSERVDAEGDAGLLAIAFHPRFAENGVVFLSYALRGGLLKSRLSRFVSSNGGASFDMGSEQVLIEIDQPDPEKIHLNCDMRFGKDGYLWVGFGDGGFDEDDRGVAQNRGDINGKILRIDVDRTGPGGRPYGIPADNPFVGQAGARGEVWAVGFRNPWRWRFDPAVDGVLWVGDLGSDRREEVNRVVRGGNYGWNRFEGTLCVSAPCSAAGMTAPHVEYKHGEGKSVTVGPVYQGQAVPGLRDRLVFGDFVSGHVWALPPDRSARPELLLATTLGIVSFAETADNELYLVDYYGGRIHQVVAAPPAAGYLPTSLAQTGCLEAPGTTLPHLVPYDVNAPLWSDGASKRRWMALPPGGKVTVAGDGDFQVPPGTTLVKEFSVGATRVETRLFVRHDDGVWAGYTYAWNAGQTDATLVGLTSAPTENPVAGAVWTHPTRYQCLACHTPEAGYSLGLEIAQLNRVFTYPDGARNQLAHFQQAGLLAAPLPAAPEALPALPTPDGDGPVGGRARAYLHANCAGCHRPNAKFPDGIDLRYTVPLGQTRTCGVEAIYGGFPGANQRIAPGNPTGSVVPRFMRSTDEFRMPLVGTTKVDEAGAGLIEAWIDGLSGCN